MTTLIIALHIASYIALIAFCSLAAVNEYNRYLRAKEVLEAKRRLEKSAKEFLHAVEEHIKKHPAKKAAKKRPARRK